MRTLLYVLHTIVRLGSPPSLAVWEVRRSKSLVFQHRGKHLCSLFLPDQVKHKQLYPELIYLYSKKNQCVKTSCCIAAAVCCCSGWTAMGRIILNDLIICITWEKDNAAMHTLPCLSNLGIFRNVK